MHLLDEVLEHGLGIGEIGDHPVLHRPDGGDVARGPAQHLLGFHAHRCHRAVAAEGAVLAHRHHRGFVQDDALAAHVDQGVGRAQVDGQVVGEHAAQLLEEHRCGSSCDAGAKPVRAAGKKGVR